MRPRVIVSIALLLCFIVFGCNNEGDTRKESNKSSRESSVHIPKFDTVSTDQVFVYNCADSLEFTAHVMPDSAWLFLADTTVKTLATRSASGARYEGGKYLYWSKGSEAILQKPKGSFMQCRSVTQERSWAAAELRGIDFRALGQEPGWIIEIRQNEQTQYIGNYGKDTLYFSTPKPRRNNSGNTTYDMRGKNNTLNVTITDSSCTDTMSGFEYPQTVAITVNDTTTYNGCGRYLN
ncbi:MliC family protein [Fodinibius sp. N2]|uniref:MliC family protein n=1 Tax=Fodinibius alkaliphilus TaxID=3140241 RepID=UPI00315A6AAD